RVQIHTAFSLRQGKDSRSERQSQKTCAAPAKTNIDKNPKATAALTLLVSVTVGFATLCTPETVTFRLESADMAVLIAVVRALIDVPAMAVAPLLAWVAVRPDTVNCEFAFTVSLLSSARRRRVLHVVAIEQVFVVTVTLIILPTSVQRVVLKLAEFFNDSQAAIVWTWYFMFPLTF
ncbi:hypothetical protein ACFOYZ_29980, partial [Neobacillus cucumis]|uniref:hypothetical protein n=1 Tax=Neobacillus cucumis TaxID=1740721 RepID=UPI003616BA68